MTVLKNSMSSMHFVPACKINCFPIFMFFTYEEKLSMTMSLENFLNFNDSEAVSSKHATCN